MSRPRTLSPAQIVAKASARLARYREWIAAYREQWGIPPDREAHLNAWAAARKEPSDAPQATPR